MTRRLVVVIVVTVVGTLLVAALTTVVVARWQSREATESVLRDQAESLAVAAGGIDPSLPAGQQAATRAVLRALRRALRVDGVEFVRLDAGGAIVGTLPAGVRAGDLDPVALAAGRTVSGANGSLVWAAAPQVRPRTTIVAVVTQESTTRAREALPFFIVASAFTLAIGALIAVLLGRRLARPVDAAAGAARRIAAGELSTRLPEPAAHERDELAGLTRSINSMAAGLERSKTLEQQFLLSVSHDLRTPLTSIHGYAEAIDDGTATDAPAAARVILAESARLERLVADLLDLAHLDGRSLAMHPIPHDLRADALAAVEAASAPAARDGIEIVLAPGPDVAVHADPARVHQLLANLLDNGRKFARSRIEVHVSADADVGVVRVDDDGPGIAPDDRPHVFDRLYVTRQRPVRAEIGSGLGLAIVRQLAEAMGGTVGADAAPIGGARMEVRLPVPHTSLTSP